MIKAINITNQFEEQVYIDLFSPERSGLIVQSIDGLGPGPATINLTNLAVDGSIYNSSRINPRQIVFNLIFDGIDIEEVRHKTYRFFALKMPISMAFHTDHRDLAIDGYVSGNQPTIFSEKEGCQITIECPFPYFHAIGEKETDTTSFFGAEPLFEFPFSNLVQTREIEFGTINNIVSNTITYEGDADTGMLINLHLSGDVGDIGIHHLDRKERFEIDSEKIIDIMGSPLQAGDDIVINTNVGAKSLLLVRDGKTYNILSAKRVPISKWLRLHKGNNEIAFVSSHDSAQMFITITNNVLYEGI